MNRIHSLRSQSATVTEHNPQIMKPTMETTAATHSSHSKKIQIDFVFFFPLNFFNVINIALFIC